MVATLKVSRKKHKQLEALATDGPTTIKVGFPKSKAPRASIMKAIYNEFGTRGGASGGGWGGPIPERPFMRGSIRRNKNKYRNAMKDAALPLLTGVTTMSVVLGRLGALAVQDMKNEAVNLTNPPNSPTTIKLKGSSNPLVDTGEMIGSITFAREK